MNSVFIKVPVSERLPKNYGSYIIGYGTTKRFVDFTERTNHDSWRMNFEWWLEEVSLPTDKEIYTASREVIGDFERETI